MRLQVQGRSLLRLAGLVTWTLSGLPFLVSLSVEPSTLLNARYVLWVGAYLVFLLAFLLNRWEEAPDRARVRALILIALQSVAALVMIRFVCSGYEGALLAIVAAQLGWFLRPARALLWTAAQGALLGLIVASSWPTQLTLRLLATYLGLQTLTLFSSVFAASEARARAELARVNAELRATQELLVESGRLAERERISRELHDVLGHGLTALSLNLEAAGHLGSEPALTHIRRAQAMTKQMLGDLRTVVSALRKVETLDLTSALRALVESVASPRIHLEVHGELRIADPLRAHALLRCVQEIITNTVRHAAASHLWIDLVETEGRLEVRARDDGRGAQRLRPGYGLTGMRERIEELGGRLEIQSQPRDGFEVRAWMPVQGAAT
jgi:signal transduction histidine kinase